jgi:DNA-binding XRE family transcriptional regulator
LIAPHGAQAHAASADHPCHVMFFTSLFAYEISHIRLNTWADPLITAFQMRAARALLGIDQRSLAELAGVSLPTIQRMEASVGNVRGVVESLTRVVEALNRAGVELIGEHARSDEGGRGVRLKEPGPPRRP